MQNRRFVAGYRLLLGLLASAAIVVQFLGTGKNHPLNFFSFFTIESNILGVIVFLVGGAMLLRKTHSEKFDSFRGMVAVYMITTGIVYALLLSGLEAAQDSTISWVNFVLHYLMPVMFLTDWLIDLPRRKISLKTMFSWLIFPLAYVAYSLIRGHRVDWYPYPFLDPREQGYVGVLGYSVGIAAAIIAICLAVRALSGIPRKLPK